VWASSKLETVFQFIERERFGERDVVFHSLFFCDRPSLGYSRVLPVQGIGQDTVGDYLFCRGGMMQTSCLVIPRASLLACGFDSRLRKHQDWDLCIRLQSQGHFFRFLDVPLTYWDQSGTARVSNTSIAYSYEWIGRIKGVSPRARAGFVARVVLPAKIRAGDWLTAVFPLLSMYFGRVISLKELISVLTEGPFVGPIKRKLKAAAVARAGVISIREHT
jgi:hypothetical protein